MLGRLTYEMEQGSSGYLFTPETSIHGLTMDCPWGTMHFCPVVKGMSDEHWSYEGAIAPNDGDLIRFLDTGRVIVWDSEKMYKLRGLYINGKTKVDFTRVVQDALF